MKEYVVTHTNGEQETFYNLQKAKAAMKADKGSTGFIYKIYADGAFEPCGYITLKGSNAVRMSNQTKATYN